MSTLLQISEGLLAFQRLLDESDGELTPEVEAALDQWFAELSDARDQKLDAYAALIRECTLRASVRKAEQERLALRVRVDEKLAKALKERLKLFLEVQGISKVETQRYRITVCKNGGKQPLEVNADPSALPAVCQRITIAPDLDAIYKHLESGIPVAGCRLLPRGKHVRIS
jgi:hypothetical protein